MTDMSWGKVKNKIQSVLQSKPVGNTSAGAGMALLEIIEQIQDSSDTKTKDEYG